MNHVLTTGEDRKKLAMVCVLLVDLLFVAKCPFYTAFCQQPRTLMLMGTELIQTCAVGRCTADSALECPTVPS